MTVLTIEKTVGDEAAGVDWLAVRRGDWFAIAAIEIGPVVRSSFHVTLTPIDNRL